MTESKKTTAKAESAPAKAEVSVSRQEKLGLPTIPYETYTAEDTDRIKLSSIVYKNIYMRKSLSVLHLQRRLNELGYPAAQTGGWYEDTTKQAVTDYQSDNKLEATGLVDRATFESIFEDDPNVSLDFS